MPRGSNLRSAINLTDEEVSGLVGDLCGRNFQLTVLVERDLDFNPDSAVEDLADNVFEFPHFSGEALWRWPVDELGSDQEIRRLWNDQLEQLQETGSRTSAMVKEQQRQFCLYYAPGHPGPHILASLYAELSERMGLLADSDNRARFARAIASIWRTKGLAHISYHPLPVRIVSALGFEWAEVAWYKHWQRGVSVSRQGNLDGCLEELGKALGSPACDPHVHYTAGLAHQGLGEMDEARLAYQMAMRAYPANETYTNAWLDALQLDGDDLSSLRMRLEQRFRLGAVN